MPANVTPHMAEVTPTLGQLWPLYFLTKNVINNQPTALTITWQIDKGNIFIYNLQKVIPADGNTSEYDIQFRDCIGQGVCNPQSIKFD